MSRKTYTAKEKEDALQLCDEIGTKKASEQTGIFINTLYNWRREKVGATVGGTEVEAPADVPVKSKKRAAARRTLVTAEKTAGKPAEKIALKTAEKPVDQELVHLRIENTTLRAQLNALKNALKAFTE